jgi:hypothetical protein
LSGRQALFAAVLESHLLPTQQCRHNNTGAVIILDIPHGQRPVWIGLADLDLTASAIINDVCPGSGLVAHGTTASSSRFSGGPSSTVGLL